MTKNEKTQATQIKNLVCWIMQHPGKNPHEIKIPNGRLLRQTEMLGLISWNNGWHVTEEGRQMAKKGA